MRKLSKEDVVNIYELKGNINELFYNEHNYSYKLENLFNALKNGMMLEYEDVKQYATEILYALDNDIIAVENHEEIIPEIDFIIDILLKIVQEETPLADLVTLVEQKLKERLLPYSKRTLTPVEVYDYLAYFNDNPKERSEDYFEKEFYQFLIETLVENNDPVAMHIKAYLCYGDLGRGTTYICNYEITRDLLESLITYPKTYGKRADYYNTLGYIYYYKRINNKNDYQKAFINFTSGCVLGSIESAYKLADMYEKGLYVSKDIVVATELVLTNFLKIKDNFSQGDFSCEFADLAIRLARYFKNNYLSSDIDSDYMYQKFLLLAKKSLELRMKFYHIFGDDSLLEKVNDAIFESDIAKVSRHRLTGIKLDSLAEAIMDYGNSRNGSFIKIKELSEHYKLIICNNNDYTLVAIPERNYVKAHECLEIKIKKEDFIWHYAMNTIEIKSLKFYLDENGLDIIGDGDVKICSIYDKVSIVESKIEL